MIGPASADFIIRGIARAGTCILYAAHIAAMVPATTLGAATPVAIGMPGASSLRILRDYQRGVVFQLGCFWKVKGPGLVLVIPGIQQMVRVDLREVIMDVPPQDVISRDNVSVKVNAVVFFRVVDPEKSINESMVRAIARQAAAERERRAKVIHAEGEKQASAALLEAAPMLAQQPEAMQLRHLQTMTQVAGDRASTVVLPLDLLGSLMGRAAAPRGGPALQSPATGTQA